MRRQRVEHLHFLTNPHLRTIFKQKKKCELDETRLRIKETMPLALKTSKHSTTPSPKQKPTNPQTLNLPVGQTLFGIVHRAVQTI